MSKSVLIIALFQYFLNLKDLDRNEAMCSYSQNSNIFYCFSENFRLVLTKALKSRNTEQGLCCKYV